MILDSFAILSFVSDDTLLAKAFIIFACLIVRNNHNTILHLESVVNVVPVLYFTPDLGFSN